MYRRLTTESRYEIDMSKGNLKFSKMLRCFNVNYLYQMHTSLFIFLQYSTGHYRIGSFNTFYRINFSATISGNIINLLCRIITDKLYRSLIESTSATPLMLVIFFSTSLILACYAFILIMVVIIFSLL